MYFILDRTIFCYFFLKFVCLGGGGSLGRGGLWGSSHSRIFHSYGDVTIAGEGLQILIYARHSWPLSSEGSLACHIYCDTGHLFIIVISEDPRHSYLLPSVLAVKLSLPAFTT